MNANPIGHIPSPYGKPVAVFQDEQVPGGYVHDLDGCMDIAGIHDPLARDRCKTELKAKCAQGGIRFEIFLEHGGRMVPKVPLTKPSEPVYPTLPRDMSMDIPTENWATLAMDQPHWCKRAEAMLDILGSNLEQVKEWDAPPEVLAIGLSLLLTASLEHLVEDEIDCIEAAAFYALTTHPAWSKAGVEWLKPFRTSWFADWIAARPAYREFAGLCRNINTTLPGWIAGGA
ncbi:hypothetical protein [Methylobacterium sp. J-068]|uniref:hypothetical protein n=1 Tax=Methylobacterium sp. J-068 TaxID=2836649 RepID=UPI001FBA2752|nr:hypothetical protein [Methylobacterium sp. J-068]MCJ2033165.1 hypothetical protein [Methylobacterium sp. J-068]